MSKQIPFYTKLNVPPKKGVKFSKPSLTQQHERYETDIHNILLKHATPEALALYGNGRAQKAFYGDFSELPSFDQVMQMQARATEYFEGLPSAIRAQFQNDPTMFIKQVGNPQNAETLVKMGILEKMPEMVKETLEQAQQVVQNQPNVEPSPTPAGSES